MTVVDLTTERESRSWIWLFLGGWTLVVLIQASILYEHLRERFLYALLSQGVEYYTLALLSIAVWSISLRLQERRWPLWRWTLAHIVMGLAAIAVWQSVTLLWLRWWVGPDFWERIFSGNWLFQLFGTFMTYGALIGLTLAVQTSRRARERERRAARLEITTREAELVAWKAQLQPHFLFNALNSVLDLIDSDPAKAREMIVRLGELLQRSMHGIDLEHVTLEGEIALLDSYLDIEKIRFGSRLQVDMDIEPGARGASVPPLLLQPIVENAVKHAIAPNPRGGRVSVAARVSNGHLNIEVSDTGNGFEPASVKLGRGLELTRRRLEAIYGADHQLSFVLLPAGFGVRLQLPLEYV